MTHRAEATHTLTEVLAQDALASARSGLRLCGGARPPALSALRRFDAGVLVGLLVAGVATCGGMFSRSMLALGGIALATVVAVTLGRRRAPRPSASTPRVNGYELERRIGAGGMGEVWLAHAVALERSVAIKVLAPSRATDPRAIARFEREVRTMCRLRHPNTVRVFHHGVTEEGHRYYAMELLEGRNLAELVRDVGPLPPARAVGICLQVCRALAEAHDHGIVHRDVKPANLVLTEMEEGDFVRVLDFGVASHEGSTLTEGFVIGTPGYIGPEVLQGGAATVRSDVYAVGGVLWFLLTGRAPTAVVTGDPAGALEAVIRRCRRVCPSDRPASIRVLAVELASALATVDALSRAAVRPWRPSGEPK